MMEKLKNLSGKQIVLLIFLVFGAIFAFTNQKEQRDDLMVDNYENNQEVVGEATGENTGDVEGNEFEPSGEDMMVLENSDNANGDTNGDSDVVAPEPTEESTGNETEAEVDSETDTETDVEAGIPSEIILVSGEVGDYGEYITMNGNSYLIYRLPAGTYTAINAGEETAQFIIISNDTKDVNGTTYPTSTSTVLLYRDDHTEITVSDNQYIELQGESSFKFVRME